MLSVFVYHGFKEKVRLESVSYLIVRAKSLILNLHKLRYQCPKSKFQLDLNPTTATYEHRRTQPTQPTIMTHLFSEHSVLPPCVRLEQRVNLLKCHIGRLRNEVCCPDVRRCARAREDDKRCPKYVLQRECKALSSKNARRREIHEDRRQEPDENCAGVSGN